MTEPTAPPTAPSPEPASKAPGAPSAKLARAAGRFGAATMLSRLLGLVREQIFAALLGAGPHADAFVVAFRIPNLLRDLFAEGALSAAFVPTFTDALTNRRREEAFELANKVMNAIVLLLGAVVLVAIVFAEQVVQLLAAQFPPDQVERAARLTRIMLPFLPVVSLAAVAMGMLTSQSRFGAPALAPTMFNVVSILVGAGLYLAGASPETAVVGWSVGTLLGGVAQLAVQLPTLRRTGWRYSPALDLRFRDPGLRRIARLMGPATIGLAATQVNILVNTYFASGVQGAPAWLAYAFRLMQLPLGVFGVAIATVSTASLAQRAARKDLAGVGSTLGASLRLVAFLTVPATFALAALGEPIIRLIYEHGRFNAPDTHATALALAGYSLGLYAYSAVKVFAPAFYALDKPRVPLVGSMLAVGANVVLNITLFPILGFWGLALGTSVAALTNFAVLTVSFGRAGGSLAAERLWTHLARVTLAAVVAAGVGFFAARGLATLVSPATIAGRLLETLGGLAVIGGVYAVVCRILHVDELVTLLGAVRRRLGR